MVQEIPPQSNTSSSTTSQGIPCISLYGGYGTVANHDDLRLTGDLTIEAWVKANPGSSGNPVLLNKGSGSDITYNIYMSGSDVAFFQSGNQITWGSIPINEWCHIAATKSGTTVKLYLNGVEVNSGTVPATNDSSEDLYLFRDSGANRWMGSVKNLVIWKGVARTQPQVQADMATTPTSGSGLSAVYLCTEEARSSTLSDAVNGHDASLSGAYAFAPSQLPQ